MIKNKHIHVKLWKKQRTDQQNEVQKDISKKKTLKCVTMCAAPY